MGQKALLVTQVCGVSEALVGGSRADAVSWFVPLQLEWKVSLAGCVKSPGWASAIQKACCEQKFLPFFVAVIVVCELFCSQVV